MEKYYRKLLLASTLLFCLLAYAKSDDNPDETFSSFEKSNDICTKCSCTNYTNLFTLNCANKELHHTLSNWPSHANKTLRATFSHNIITSLEKFPASNCSALISLDHCAIKFLAPGLFENMKYIKYVDLSHNLITIEELSSEKFKGPYSNNEFEPIELTHLNLAYNQIHSLPKSLFDHIPRLKHLNLGGNGFKIIDLQTQMAISSVRNLEYLNLAGNGLKELPKDVLAPLGNLVEINLSKNEFRFIPEALATVRSLEVLIFDSNPIYELTDGTFNGVLNLAVLSLNNLSNVVEIHSNTFSPLKKLRKLQLSNNKNLEILESDAFGIEDNRLLKELYLTNNSLIDIPSVLLDWSDLHIFEFNDNPLMCTCNLYNITKSLNGQITRNKAGPYCIGEEELSYQVFSLDERVCEEDYIASLSFRYSIQGRFSVIRIALITMSLVALTSTFIAIVVCFAKQRKYGTFGQNHLSRSTTILYNPLNNQQTL